MKRRHGLLAPWIWVTVVILFVVAIPWYWSPDDDSIFLGFPRWTIVSIFVSALISSFTAWVFVKHWPEDKEGDS